jgi:hypothetical protein
MVCGWMVNDDRCSLHRGFDGGPGVDSTACPSVKQTQHAQ